MMMMLTDLLAQPLGAPQATQSPRSVWEPLAVDRNGPGFLPPTNGTVYGTLLNHADALAALGEQVNAAPYKAAPKAPILYIKPRNCVVGHRATVLIPADVSELEIGATLGIVIGRAASRLSESEALEFIAGFTIVNDISVPHDSLYRPSMRFKCRDGFCPIGPWVVPRAQAPNPDALGITVCIDGKTVHQSSTAGLIRPVAKLLAAVTDFMTLHPGDVLSVGIAAGAPRVRAGQHVAIEIQGLGQLENTFISERQA